MKTNQIEDNVLVANDGVEVGEMLLYGAGRAGGESFAATAYIAELLKFHQYKYKKLVSKFKKGCKKGKVRVQYIKIKNKMYDDLMDAVSFKGVHFRGWDMAIGEDDCTGTALFKLSDNGEKEIIKYVIA